MRRMLCLCNTFIKYTRVIREDRVYPILNNWYDDKSKMKTMVEDRRSSHHLDGYWCLDWAIHPRRGNKWWSSRHTWRSTDMRGSLSCIGHMGWGTRRLWFRSDPERTCKWTVCLTLDFSPCDWSLLNIYLFGGGEFILLLNAFSETYELRGCISMDISRMAWIACVACLSGKWSRLLLKSKVLWLMIKARPTWQLCV